MCCTWSSKLRTKNARPNNAPPRPPSSTDWTRTRCWPSVIRTGLGLSPRRSMGLRSPSIVATCVWSGAENHAIPHALLEPGQEGILHPTPKHQRSENLATPRHRSREKQQQVLVGLDGGEHQRRAGHLGWRPQRFRGVSLQGLIEDVQATGFGSKNVLVGAVVDNS